MWNFKSGWMSMKKEKHSEKKKRESHKRMRFNEHLRKHNKRPNYTEYKNHTYVYMLYVQLYVIKPIQ